MSVVDSILNFTSNLWSMFWNLIQSINSIWSSIINVLSYIWSILKALWLWLTSLLTPIWELISSVLWNGAISSLAQSIDSIASYIWWPAVVFIMTLFMVILVRIVVAFVFKILRLNFDYEVRKTNWAKGREQTWEKNISNSIDEFENGRHIFHW